ncbi:hypothetical protein HOE22_07015 [Candidatus Woesearchaeota archaeon]|jgi:hypothetical protein|nr:hypothetical protein [Candidatus Woesearchaeota archaeon]MBT7558492.1 hypothetical protein [Candidatus Woesearchaeota archaeon]
MVKSKLRKEIEKSPLLFDMDRLEFIRQLMILEVEVDKKDLTKESKEYKELIKYRLMDTRYMIESGLIEREVKKHVDKLTDKCITEAFEEW